MNNKPDYQVPTYVAQCHVCGDGIDDNETAVIDEDEDGEPISVAHATCSSIYSSSPSTL